MAELLEQIKQLSHADQLALIREITLNLETEADDLSPQQRVELEESSRAAHTNPGKGSDWQTVGARLLIPAVDGNI